MFYSKNYARYIREIDKLLRAVEFPAVPTDKPLSVWMEFVQPPFKTVQRDYSGSDLDNLIKPLWDAINRTGKLWVDDKQIVRIEASKRFALEGERPHTKFKAVTWREK